MTIEEFWANVKKTETCWIWEGRIDPKGYGNFFYQNKYVRAHRFAWFLTHGKYPSNLACHRCNNKVCVNPNHLYDGTNADNMKDLKLKYKHDRDIYNNLFVPEDTKFFIK